MSGVTGQAAGMAVGAAVGAVAGSVAPGAGTLAGASLGASLGSAGAGLFNETKNNDVQTTLDTSSLNLEREQARLKSAEAASANSREFRSALATQIATQQVRGGSSTLNSALSQESFGNFQRDQKALEIGLDISEAKGGIAQATAAADRETRDLRAYSRFAQSSATALNSFDLNLLAKRDK